MEVLKYQSVECNFHPTDNGKQYSTPTSKSHSSKLIYSPSFKDLTVLSALDHWVPKDHPLQKQNSFYKGKTCSPLLSRKLAPRAIWLFLTCQRSDDSPTGAHWIREREFALTRWLFFFPEADHTRSQGKNSLELFHSFSASPFVLSHPKVKETEQLTHTPTALHHQHPWKRYSEMRWWLSKSLANLGLILSCEGLTSITELHVLHIPSHIHPVILVFYLPYLSYVPHQDVSVNNGLYILWCPYMIMMEL